MKLFLRFCLDRSLTRRWLGRFSKYSLLVHLILIALFIRTRGLEFAHIGESEHQSAEDDLPQKRILHTTC